jgi:hypothetical protein
VDHQGLQVRRLITLLRRLLQATTLPSLASLPSSRTIRKWKVQIVQAPPPAENWLRKAPPAGLEPATLGLEDRCSIRMSYGGVPPLLFSRTTGRTRRVVADRINSGPDDVARQALRAPLLRADHAGGCRWTKAGTSRSDADHLPPPLLPTGFSAAKPRSRRTQSVSPAAEPGIRSAQEDPIGLSGGGAGDTVRPGGPDRPLRRRSRGYGPPRRTRSASPVAEPGIRSAQEDPIGLSGGGAGDTVRPGGPDRSLRRRSRGYGPPRRTRSASPAAKPGIRSANEDPIRLTGTGGTWSNRGNASPSLRVPPRAGAGPLL